MNAFKLRHLLVGLVTLGSLALAGCGGGFDCTTVSKCPNDGANNQEGIDACKQAEAATCGSQFSDAENCFTDHQTCDAQGETDLVAAGTLGQAGGACFNQDNALRTCCTANPTSEACTLVGL